MDKVGTQKSANVEMFYLEIDNVTNRTGEACNDLISLSWPGNPQDVNW